jgi:parvulin-like peptidyl-prolyl isomerase
LVETRIVPGIEISDQDVKAYYEENPGLFMRADKIHCRHILFVVDPDADDETREKARKKAELAHARALSGENFAALAVELSEGPNAATGGDLGFTARGQMVESFDDAVWALEPGEISEVVESRLGYHVIKVEEIVPGETIPLEEVRQPVTEMMRQQRIGMALAEHVAKLRDTAVIRTPEL